MLATLCAPSVEAGRPPPAADRAAREAELVRQLVCVDRGSRTLRACLDEIQAGTDGGVIHGR